MKPEDRADERQRESVRKELHAIVNRVVDAWPMIGRQAREMTRGFAGGAAGAGASVGVSDPTMRAALFDGSDPGQRSEEWLAHLREFIGHAKNLDAERRRLTPVDPKTVDRQRINAEICPECGQPVLNGGKRLDGELFHHSAGDDPPCFKRAYNRVRGLRGGMGYTGGTCADGAA